MTDSQQRHGWMRLALAAAALAVLVMVVPRESTGSTRATTHIIVPAGSASPSLSARWKSWEWPVSAHGTGADYVMWSAILPVLFIGLVAPLVLERMLLVHADARMQKSPLLPSAFQRPPPQLA